MGSFNLNQNVRVKELVTMTFQIEESGIGVRPGALLAKLKPRELLEAAAESVDWDCKSSDSLD